jgi:hypothetical protein
MFCSLCGRFIPWRIFQEKYTNFQKDIYDTMGHCKNCQNTINCSEADIERMYDPEVENEIED